MESNIKLNSKYEALARFEAMLNSYTKVILPSPMPDSLQWLAESDNQYAFTIKDEDTQLYLYFNSSFQEAQKLAEQQQLTQSINLRWGVNGPVLFIITGNNTWQTGELAGYIAGEE